jgi:cytochrome c peroxidase
MDPSAVTPDGRLPNADSGPPGADPSDAAHLRNIFYRMGFNDREIVCLSGAHALGRCHTTASGYDGPWTATPTTFVRIIADFCNSCIRAGDSNYFPSLARALIQSNAYYTFLTGLEWERKEWNGE